MVLARLMLSVLHPERIPARFAKEFMMQGPQQSLIARDDTFLGVCQAIGDDFGFNPVYLRVAFAVPVIYSPGATILAYLATGIVVLISRLLVRQPRRARVPQPVEGQLPEPVEAATEAPETEAIDQYRLPIAA
jgi:phage shock protein C